MESSIQGFLMKSNDFLWLNAIFLAAVASLVVQLYILL